jgi:phosphatidylglycerophosphatase A
MRRFVILFATWGGAGYSPVASGTVGTMAAIPFYLLLARLPLSVYLLTLVPFFFFACWA